MSKTVVYAHFRGGKAEMLLELYARASDRVLQVLVTAAEQARADRLPWRERLHAVVHAYLSGLAEGPAVARALLVEVQAMGITALPHRRRVVERYVDVLEETTRQLVAEHPQEVRPTDRGLLLAAVGGINELLLARVERGEADRLAEDAGLAAALLVRLLERHP